MSEVGSLADRQLSVRVPIMFLPLTGTQYLADWKFGRRLSRIVPIA